MRPINGSARCVSCNWYTYGGNSMANAGRHNNKTGHAVYVEIIYAHTFPEKNKKEEE